MPPTRPLLDPERRREDLARKIRVQLAVFGLVYLAMTILVVMRIRSGGVELPWVIGMFVFGCLLGGLLVRTRPLGKNAEEQVVVGSMTMLGLAAVVLYVLVLIFRDTVLGEFIRSTQTLGAATLSITAGVMAGRMVAEIRQIRHLLGLRGAPPTV